jgi:hypothetical protein
MKSPFLDINFPILQGTRLLQRHKQNAYKVAGSQGMPMTGRCAETPTTVEYT